jgi:hypothetical protein
LGKPADIDVEEDGVKGVLEIGRFSKASARREEKDSVDVVAVVVEAISRFDKELEEEEEGGKDGFAVDTVEYGITKVGLVVGVGRWL